MSQGAKLSPEHIMKVGAGYWSSKVLLTAVDFELFTKLGEEGLRASEIEEGLNLHPRGTRDFLDALLSLGFLEREGDGDDPLYRNTPETAAFLNKEDPRYIGGILEMFNQRLFEYWDGLDDALQTGRPQNEIKESGESMFDALFADQDKLEGFMEAMSGISKGNFMAFAQKFDFSDYDSMTDVGGALANMSRIVAKHHSHLSFTSMDLPPVTELARERIREDGLEDRIEAVSRNYYEDPIPEADLVTASLILHDLNLEEKRMLIEKIYDAVRPGGTFVAIDHIIDDERRENTMGLLMSLNMLIEFGEDGGFDYTGEQFASWARDAGFEDIEVEHLAGPVSMAIAQKR